MQMGWSTCLWKYFWNESEFCVNISVIIFSLTINIICFHGTTKREREREKINKKINYTVTENLRTVDLCLESLFYCILDCIIYISPHLSRYKLHKICWSTWIVTVFEASIP